MKNNLLFKFFNFKDVVVCTKTYDGGCANIDEKLIGFGFSDRPYTIEECHLLCTAEPECSGFFLGTTDRKCMLVRDGCIDNDNPQWVFYAISDCNSNNNF